MVAAGAVMRVSWWEWPSSSQQISKAERELLSPDVFQDIIARVHPSLAWEIEWHWAVLQQQSEQPACRETLEGERQKRAG